MARGEEGDAGLCGELGLCAPGSDTGSGSSGMVSGLLVPLALGVWTPSTVCLVTLQKIIITLACEQALWGFLGGGEAGR